MGAVTFDPQAFTARYPEFSLVAPATLTAYFADATLYLDNTDTSPVADLTQRSSLLNMLVAHLAALSGPTATFSGSATFVSQQMTVTAVTAGSVLNGMLLTSAGVAAGTAVTGQISGAPGGIGVYSLSADPGTITAAQTVNGALAGGILGRGMTGLVGRVSSATTGSVTVQADMGAAPGTAAWYMQTPYGAAYWTATAPYRTMRYRAGRSLPAPMQPIYGRWGRW